MRVLCCREVQKSIKESVHTLLVEQIQKLELGYFYTVTESEIKGVNGSIFRFTGLAQHTVESVKSFESIQIAWIEEAQTVSKKSWDILLPTIRLSDSEIWISMNPELDTDESWTRFILNTPPNSMCVEINYFDNPWFNDVLEAERQQCLRTDPKNYDNIWLGKPKSVIEGAIYADEVLQMLTEHRVTLVKPDPVMKSHIVVDLGWNDAMAIIVAQRVGSECRITHYIEETHQTLDWYSSELRKLNLNWGKLWLPHDAVQKDYRTGKSAAEIMTQLGWDVEVIPIGDVEHGIRLARMLMPRVWLDKDNTVRLQECLKRYRRTINSTTNHPGSPLHDSYSHGADAFRYLATAIDSFRNDNVKPRRQPDRRPTNWMSV
jgi:phage terminase large subunit